MSSQGNELRLVFPVRYTASNNKNIFSTRWRVLLCQEQVSKVGASIFIQQYMWNIYVYILVPTLDTCFWHNTPVMLYALQWRHNERDGVSNHRRLHCLFNCWFRRKSKTNQSFASLTFGQEFTGSVTGKFSAQTASNAENASVWWRHHVPVTHFTNGVWAHNLNRLTNHFASTLFILTVSHLGVLSILICRQATSHYLSQCWPRCLSPYDVTRPQWVNALKCSFELQLRRLLQCGTNNTDCLCWIKLIRRSK